MAFLTHFQIFGKNLKSNLYQTPCASYVGQDVSEILCHLEKCVFTYFETSKEPLFFISNGQIVHQQSCSDKMLMIFPENSWKQEDAEWWCSWWHEDIILISRIPFRNEKFQGWKISQSAHFHKDLTRNDGRIRWHRLSCHWPWILESPNWHELSAADSIGRNSADFIQLCELEFLANEFDGGRWGEVW